MTIHIDLKNLTEEKIQEALAAGRDDCLYTSPCIVGSLMTDDERNQLKLANRDGWRISALIDKGEVTCPTGQSGDIMRLQSRFDTINDVSDDEFVKFARSLLTAA
jgi:hypothetical protein